MSLGRASHICYKCGSIILEDEHYLIVHLDKEALTYLKYPLKVCGMEYRMECPLCEDCHNAWDKIYTKWFHDQHSKDWWIKGWAEFMGIIKEEVFILS